MVFLRPDAKIPTKIQLADNGNGLVDLTHNDGIYSAVFPYVAKQGFYAVQVIADDNNGQAVIPKDDQSIQSGKAIFRLFSRVNSKLTNQRSSFC